LFARAISEEWTTTKFQGEIRSTKWYRARSKSQRAYDEEKLNDPKSWSQEVEHRKSLMTTYAKQLGMTMSSRRVDSLAKSSYRNGFDQSELYRLVAAEVNFDPKKAYGGEIGSTQSKVREVAAAYGVNLSDQAMDTAVERLIRQEQTLEGLTNQYKEQAKRNYGHFAKELDSGVTLRELADPYMQSMANILEINPKDLNLSDKTIQRALLQKNKDNTTKSMTSWEFEDLLRNDSRWLKTDNAQESLMGMGRSLLNSFGLAV
jgi:hypothetical protein